MCGIFGYIGHKKNSPQIVLDGLKSLEYRGYDSWGIAAVPTVKPKNKNQKLKTQTKNIKNPVVIKKRVGKIGQATVRELPPANIAIGHTRWATHGTVTQKNAHPHLDCSSNLALIHNGIIENYQALKNKLLHQGHKFISDTDSEVAVHLIESVLNNKSLCQAVRFSFNKLQGLNAIIIIHSQTSQLVAARNGSPLVIGLGKNENYLASDASALLPYTKKVYFLQDDELTSISDKKVIVRSTQTGKWINIRPQKLTWKVSHTSRGKFPHFMLKEIHEQPKLLSAIAQDSQKQITQFSQIIKKAYGTYLVGCGTAAYACIAGAYLFSKIAKLHVNHAIGSEFGYHLDFLTQKSLVLALSQSGETIDTLESIKKAGQKGAKVASLVNVLGSTLYRESDYKLLLSTGPEIGVASTKAFTAKIAYLTLIAYQLINKPSQGQKVLVNAAKSSKHVLSTKSVNKIHQLAKKLSNCKDIYVIGRGLSYPASLETALKIKETSYIHAEGFAAGELKHGVIALIEKDTPCIAFLPNDETYGANLAGAMEMKARGGFIIGVSHRKHEVFDFYLPVSDAQEATIIPNVIVGQLLAYYLTIERGFDPDKPRNLAKSVTVK